MGLPEWRIKNIIIMSGPPPLNYVFARVGYNEIHNVYKPIAKTGHNIRGSRR
jgi:hypothetical protein